MKDWNEGSIAFVYYSGLLIALALGIIVTRYLKAKGPLTTIIGKSSLWFQSFRSTLSTAGFLGAMTVLFRGCDCDCGELIGNPEETINLGIAQVKAASMTLAGVAAGWLMILIVAQQFSRSIHWKAFLVSLLFVAVIAVPMLLVWFITYTFR